MRCDDCDCISCLTVKRWRDMWRRGIMWRNWAAGSRDESAAFALMAVL